MNSEEKRELICLLNKYQNELLKQTNKEKWNTGIKAQYNHARIIANKLSNEKDNEIIPLYNDKVREKQ